MINKLFVASTTGKKIQSKKARVRLRQSEVFFPLAYEAVVANRSIVPSPSPSPIKCGRRRHGLRR